MPCSTQGLQHHLIVLTLGWDQGTHNGAFLSCNDLYKAQICRETIFGHCLTKWLIINIRLCSIIVQSLCLFVKHFGLAVGWSAVLYVDLASAVTAALDWTKTSVQNKQKLRGCCFSRKCVCKPSKGIMVIVKLQSTDKLNCCLLMKMIYQNILEDH